MNQKWTVITNSSYSYNRPNYGRPWNRGQLIRPTKMVIVHTMQGKDDLDKSSQERRSSLKHPDARSHSSRSGYKTLINLQTVGNGSSSLNTQQRRYQARLKPPSRLHQRLEERTCKHTYKRAKPREGQGKKNTLENYSHCSPLSI